MKILVGRKLLKIRILLSATLRFRRLIRCFFRKISFWRSLDRARPESSPLCLRRPPMDGRLHGARTRDRASFDRRRRRELVPEGCVAVYVGEERRRFVIPLIYLSHPFITRLLAEAEKELGYEHGGPLTFTCNVDDFEQVKWLIDNETVAAFCKR